MVCRAPLAVLLVGLLGPALGQPEAACDAALGACPGWGSEEASFIQRHQREGGLAADGAAKGARKSAVDHSALAGKSVYFLPVDRFAKHGADASTEACDTSNDWCNGTLRGVTEHLDYIQGMGFDCVWITPVVKQYDGPVTSSGTGCMGYWAYDLYKIDPHFGKPRDLKRLVQGLHDRGMCIVYDFVANHMGPIHNEAMVKHMRPFDKPEYFNQLFRGNLTFDEYTAKSSDWPPPAQAMWSQSGAQCTQGKSCNCYACPEGTAPFQPCDKVFDEGSVCPKRALSPYCMPGDYACEGYNETITQRGWFYDLGDLNQSNPFVRKGQLDWVSWFVKEYDIDVLRLDTAAFMAFDFLSELQEAAGVPIIGEVTTTNVTFHAQFQANPPGSENPVLAGVLNFPLYYSALAGFCGEWFPFSTFNLTFLGERMTQQLSTPYTDLDTLGNFIDNHDVERLASYCKNETGPDLSRVSNALAWTMLIKGVPIVYYGTEELTSSRRESLWVYGYRTDTRFYRYLGQLNGIRKDHGIALDSLEVVPLQDASRLVFTRGGSDKLWVYLNNLVAADAPVAYCGAEPPAPKEGFRWVDALSSLPATFKEGCFEAADTYPKVLVQAPAGAAPPEPLPVGPAEPPPLVWERCGSVPGPCCDPNLGQFCISGKLCGYCGGRPGSLQHCVCQ